MNIFGSTPDEDQALLESLGGMPVPPTDPEAARRIATLQDLLGQQRRLEQSSTPSSVLFNMPKPPTDSQSGPVEPPPPLPWWKQQVGKTFDNVFDIVAGMTGMPGSPNTDARQFGEVLSAGAPILTAGPALLNKLLKTKTPAVPHIERAPVGMIDDRMLMSNRVPTAVNAPAQTGVLHTGLPEVLGVPEVADKMAVRLRKDPMVVRPGRTSEGVLEKFIDTAQANYEFLIRQMAPYAERSRQWYDGAHKISSDLSQRFGLSQDQTSGVLAVLSPQKDWHQNAQEAQNAIRTYTELGQNKIKFSQDLIDHYIGTSTLSETRALSKLVKDGKITDQHATMMAENSAWLRRLRTDAMRDRVWGDMPREDQAIFMRAYSELEHGQSYPILTPEGGIADAIARNKVPQAKPGQPQKEGKASKLSWNQYDDLEKVIQILDDGSAASISEALGGEHKVRSFFNNINHPNYGLQLGERGASTIDTHAVAGGHLQPFSQSAGPVNYAMGGVGHELSGLSGSNALYQEALTRAGRNMGMLPREAQSVSWEGLKGLFDPSQKSNEQLQKVIMKLWRDYNKGGQSLGSVQDAILNEAGGIAAPAWARKP